MGSSGKLEHKTRRPIINNRLSGKRKCRKQRKEITKKMIQGTFSDRKDMSLQTDGLKSRNTVN